MFQIEMKKSTFFKKTCLKLIIWSVDGAISKNQPEDYSNFVSLTRNDLESCMKQQDFRKRPDQKTINQFFRFLQEEACDLSKEQIEETAASIICIVFAVRGIKMNLEKGLSIPADFIEENNFSREQIRIFFRELLNRVLDIITPPLC
jgi:hypothetical protein